MLALSLPIRRERPPVSRTQSVSSPMGSMGTTLRGMGTRARLVDRFGREVRDLRISVTDRCNFRCSYCLPEEGIKWLPREELLTFEEIARLARVLVSRFGVDSIRLTGGEPTVRAELDRLVAMLTELRPLATDGLDLSMTTNGVALPLLADRLRTAGLDRVNISLDTLRSDRFHAITKRDQLARVLEGIQAAKEAGFAPIKVNVVTMRGINDDEVVDFAAWGRREGVEVRFIEFMPLDGAGAWDLSMVVSAEEIVAKIDAVFPLEAIPRSSAPATTYRFRDGQGTIGVIPTVTKPFCGDCDRIRLTAEGRIRTCLFALDEHDLRGLIRQGATDEELAVALTQIVGTKWAGHSIGNVSFKRPHRSMSQIGG
jgi:cyclic pyranopterin phosphate synthase